MPYPFLGDSARTYPQYLNADGSGTLHTDPGGLYDMTPAAGIHELSVPPGDGLWGPWEAPGGPESAQEDPPVPTPAPAPLAFPPVPPSAPPEPAEATAAAGETEPQTGPAQESPPPDGTAESGAAEAATEEEGD